MIINQKQNQVIKKDFRTRILLLEHQKFVKHILIHLFGSIGNHKIIPGFHIIDIDAQGFFIFGSLLRGFAGQEASHFCLVASP